MTATVTSIALLEELRGGDNNAWRQFCARYEPVVRAMARGAGLQEQDVQNVVQETLAAFLQAFRAGKYDRERGRLRSYFQGIAIHKIQEERRKWAHREVQVSGQTDSTAAMDRIPDDATLTDVFVKVEERQLLAEWIEEVRGKVETATFAAFDLQARAGWPPEQIAEHLGMSVGAVYQATFRVTSRLRKLRSQISDSW